MSNKKAVKQSRWNFSESYYEVKVKGKWQKNNKKRYPVFTKRAVSEKLLHLRSKLLKGEDAIGLSLCSIGKDFGKSVAAVKHKINAIARDQFESQMEKPSVMSDDKWKVIVSKMSLKIADELIKVNLGTKDEPDFVSIPDYTSGEARSKARQEDEGFLNSDLLDQLDVTLFEIPQDLLS